MGVAVVSEKLVQACLGAVSDQIVDAISVVTNQCEKELIEQGVPKAGAKSLVLESMVTSLWLHAMHAKCHGQVLSDSKAADGAALHSKLESVVRDFLGQG